MAKIQELFDRNTGEVIYPRTATQAVCDAEGRDLETRLAAEEVKTDEKLGQYTKTDALTKQLAAKQNALTVSEDLKLTDAGALSVAEGAKRAVFIDLFNAAAGKWGKYDPDNAPDADHPFYLNKLWLTWEQAVLTYVYGRDFCDKVPPEAVRAKVVTNLLTQESSINYNIMPWRSFRGWSGLKVIRVSDEPRNAYTGRSCYNSSEYISDCQDLEEVLGVVTMMNDQPGWYSFVNCPKLRTLKIAHLHTNIDLSTLKSLSAESIQYMVDWRGGTAAITITVHADVFAKLTGDTTNEASAALTEEELAQWAQVLTDALEKNITFATV